jgi:hypothetical protein
MIIEAKVKPEYRWNRIILFSGVEYTKDKWQVVPVGKEAEAALPEYCLELRVRPDQATLDAEEDDKLKLVQKAEAKEAQAKVKADAKAADEQAAKTANEQAVEKADAKVAAKVEAKAEKQVADDKAEKAEARAEAKAAKETTPAHKPGGPK